MKTRTFTRSSQRRVALTAAAVATIGAVAVALPALATPSPHKPVYQGARYLALGDSVPFGYREAANLPTPDYSKAKSFVGFPELVAKDFGLKVANLACPGETTGSMINVKRPSNGCESKPGGGPGYRDAYPLHVSYSGSQLRYAVKWLKAHRNTRLVTLMIGANDGFLCEETTPDHCTSPQEIQAVLTRVQNNVGMILEKLRDGAGYAGQLVVVNYYSLDYADPTQNALSKALNGVIDTAAKPWHVRVAAGYSVFRLAAAQAGGDSCAAGLLTILNGASTPCGVHPSLGGHALLASAVERVTRKS